MAAKCAKDLVNYPNQHADSSAMSESPIICLVNGLSGGRKGSKVQQIFNQNGICPTFDLMRLSNDGTYWKSFISHITKMYTTVIENESVLSDKSISKNNKVPLRPLILIAGGDGTISWALSTIDRAFLDPSMLNIFWRRHCAHSVVDSVEDDDSCDSIESADFATKRRLSSAINISDEFFYSPGLKPQDKLLSMSSIAINQHSKSSHDLGANDNLHRTTSEPIPSNSSPSKLNETTNSSDSEQSDDLNDVLREFQAHSQYLDAPQETLEEMKEDKVPNKQRAVSSQELDLVISEKVRSAMAHKRQSNEELRIVQGIYESDIGPIIGLIPLGTGNDLSRCLGTGVTYTGSDTLITELLPRYRKAPFTKLDRWSIQFSTTSGEVKQRQTAEVLCYFHLGFEAQITWEYDQNRRANPEAFNKRWKSKMQWVSSGVGGVIDEMCGLTRTLNHVIDVYADGEKVRLPSNARSLVVCNIQSMSDGMYLWGDGPGTRKDMAHWDMPKLGDGKLEVMAARSLSKWLRIRMGMNIHYRRLAQPRKVRIVMKKTMPIAVDGEAWMEGAGIIDLELLHRVFAVVGDDEPRGITRVQLQ